MSRFFCWASLLSGWQQKSSLWVLFCALDPSGLLNNIMAIWYISWLFGYSFYMFLYEFLLCPILVLHYFLYQRFIPALAADLWLIFWRLIRHIWVIDVIDIKCYCKIA